MVRNLVDSGNTYHPWAWTPSETYGLLASVPLLEKSGVQPVFQHTEGDRGAFRMFTAQLYVRGACSQAEIIRAFGVSKSSVVRRVAKYRQEGIEGFYRARKGRGGTVMTTEVTSEAQKLLQNGYSRRETAVELGIRCDTLSKAIEQGRHVP